MPDTVYSSSDETAARLREQARGFLVQARGALTAGQDALPCTHPNWPILDAVDSALSFCGGTAEAADNRRRAMQQRASQNMSAAEGPTDRFKKFVGGSADSIPEDTRL